MEWLAHSPVMYSTYDEAVQREIVEPLLAGDVSKEEIDRFYIPAIADRVIGSFEDGYACIVNTETFWKIVELNDLLLKASKLTLVTERFMSGVPAEDAKDVLRLYLETEAKAKLSWELETDDNQDTHTYVVTLLVSMYDDFEDFQPLGFVFGNTDIDDQCAFDDGKNGDRADESEPYVRCENELLDRFDITREQIAEIIHCW